MKNFFSRPYEFSFKDFLAAGFCGVFLYFCYRALSGGEAANALELVKTLVPLIGIILGGYFVQESASIWLNRTQGAVPPASNQSMPVYSTYSYEEQFRAGNNKPTI